ncbi:MAG: polysaccharide pyruvyl transferase family protein [Planctomycetota bacterium]
MNVVIAGPFGHGTLSDEAVLAGLLRHLQARKHTAVVLSADPPHTEEIHGVSAVQAAAPGSLLSAKEFWNALGKAHLLVLASGGVVSAAGQPPARSWLAVLEHAQVAGLQTAVVGVGAVQIDDPKERARVRRLLHFFAGGLSARDEGSKQALMSYGLGACNISACGDPALALGSAVGLKPEPSRIGIVLAQSLPSRSGFGVEQNAAAPSPAAALQGLLAGILSPSPLPNGETEKWAVTLFHDATAPARALAHALTSGPAGERLTTLAADCAPAEIQARMAECSAIFSLSLHGLILAAGAGVPVAGCAGEPGAAAFLSALGLGRFALPVHDGAFAAADAVTALRELLARAAELRLSIAAKLAGLRKKEAQNERMMGLLVPRRVARARGKRISFQGDEEDQDGNRH